LKWFLPGFHPWKHDNRDLMEAASRYYDTMRGT
jgi:predicted metal-dependent hydrolase